MNMKDAILLKQPAKNRDVHFMYTPGGTLYLNDLPFTEAKDAEDYLEGISRIDMK